MVACYNEQVYGVDYGLTFAAVMELSTVKVILVLALRWGVPARHRDIPNAYVKADKEEHFYIYLAIPQGMKIQDGTLQQFGVKGKSYLALMLKKSLYGLKQAGCLWIKLLHTRLEEAGFTQCKTDVCLYYKHPGRRCDDYRRLHGRLTSHSVQPKDGRAVFRGDGMFIDQRFGQGLQVSRDAS